MVVLDTHALLWWIHAPGRLSEAAARALAGLDARRPGLVSSISFWELALKARRAPQDFRLDVSELWAEVQACDPIEVVDVDVPTWLASVKLDWRHGDPADRAIVALAASRGVPLVTKDAEIHGFYADALW